MRHGSSVRSDERIVDGSAHKGKRIGSTDTMGGGDWPRVGARDDSCRSVVKPRTGKYDV